MGYNHPDIVPVLRQVGHRPAGHSVLATCEVALLRKLAELVPGGMNRRALVCQSGREALARAIELARMETGRPGVAYLSDSPEERPSIGKDVAAVVAHPLDARIKRAREACRAAGAWLIDDESGMGPGTTGRMLAVELAEARPELYVLGRGWAAGFPFGACVTGSSSWRWVRGSSGNPLGCAVALATIRLLEDGLLEQGRSMALYLEKRLAALASARLEPELWGVGTFRTLVFGKGKDAASGFVQRCRELGLLLRAVSGDAVAVRPPLVSSERDVDFAADVLRRALGSFEQAA